MIIRRITLRLPAHLRQTAEHDARAIAESLALSLAERGGAQGKMRLELPSQGRSGPVLAAALAGRVTKGGGHGG